METFITIYLIGFVVTGALSFVMAFKFLVDGDYFNMTFSLFGVILCLAWPACLVVAWMLAEAQKR